MDGKPLALINRVSSGVALVAICVGIVAALVIIWGPGGKQAELSWRLLGSAAVTFVGAAAALLTIRFFYLNRDRAL